MKKMTDRKMDMSRGEPMSEPFFPEEPQRKELKRVGQIRDIKYPDTEEQIHGDQEQALRESDSGRLAPGFRH